MRVTLKGQKVRDFQNKLKNKYCGLSYWHNVELLFMSLLLSTYYWQTQELFLSCGFIQLKNLYYISTYSTFAFICMEDRQCTEQESCRTSVHLWTNLQLETHTIPEQTGFFPPQPGFSLMSGTVWFNRHDSLLHYLLSDGTYSGRKLFLQLC